MNRIATRITTGAAILASRIRAALARWVASGRRPDLSGWRAALGPLARAGLLLAAGYVVVRLVRAAPAVLWLLAPAWLVAAWRAAPRPAPPEAAAEPRTKPPTDPRAALARWLLQAIGDRPGIHLYELYPAMRQLPGKEGASDTTLRAALLALGVTVTRSMRVPPVEGRSGVRREDVLALLSPAGERPGEQYGDAGQPTDSPGLSATGEQVKSA